MTLLDKHLVEVMGVHKNLALTMNDCFVQMHLGDEEEDLEPDEEGDEGEEEEFEEEEREGSVWEPEEDDGSEFGEGEEGGDGPFIQYSRDEDER